VPRLRLRCTFYAVFGVAGFYFFGVLKVHVSLSVSRVRL